MRLAFVIRLGENSRPSEGLFEGWVEEVDSCTERRFRSTSELLDFLGQCFDSASPLTGESRQVDRTSSGEKKTGLRKNCPEQ
jgi:hypothetical protein